MKNSLPKILNIAPNEILRDYMDKFFTEYGSRYKSTLPNVEIPSIIDSFHPRCVFLYYNLKNDKNEDIYGLIADKASFSKISVILYSFDHYESNEAIEHKYVHFLKIPIENEHLHFELDKIIHNKKYILYVDDSKLMHEQVRQILTEHNFSILEAYNGKEALEVLENHRPDVILSDIEMPVMNGYAFCKAVKQNSELEKIPFIVLSSLGTGIDIDRGFDAGANDYLTKPVDEEELVSRINALLNETKKSTRERILVIDDSKTVRNLMIQAFEQQGFKVFSAIDGLDGLQKAQDIKPDLITSDYDMPNMNGWELCQDLRKDKNLKNIPIVMLTSRDAKSDKAKMVGTGVKEYLTKPFSTDKLIVIVERLLAEQKMQREREILKFYISDAAYEGALSKGKKPNSKEHMQAKEIFATVIFTDIIAFSSLCEKYQPNEVIELLNEYYDIMCSILKKYDAIIDKFIGDAILSIFGEGERGAYRAVSAGLEMMKSLENFNKNNKNPINMRCGINSGKLFFGDLGSKLFRRDYTVIGDNVNIAQRLESTAKPNHVLISESTYQLIKNYVKVEPMGSLKLKGKQEAINAYHVIELLDSA